MKQSVSSAVFTTVGVVPFSTGAGDRAPAEVGSYKYEEKETSPEEEKGLLLLRGKYPGRVVFQKQVEQLLSRSGSEERQDLTERTFFCFRLRRGV